MLATRLWYPVYDRQLRWTGIRLETDTAMPVSDNLIEQICENTSGIENFNNKQFFIDAQLLTICHDLSKYFTPEQLTIVLTPAFLNNPDHIPLCLSWLDQKAQLAIDSLQTPDAMAPDTLSVRLVNAAAAKVMPDQQLFQQVRQQGGRLFAQAIGSMPLFKWCCDTGFEHFTFSSLNCVEPSNTSKAASALPIMELLSLVTADADIKQVEEIFKREPTLAFDLLKLVNSAAFSSQREITSFSQAIMMLGQKQLMRWLQLLLYANQSTDQGMPNILMQRAAERGRMMELLAESSGEEVNSEQAFMVGVFSMLDVLMSTPLKKLLKSVTLPQPVQSALLERNGKLGQLLSLVCATENSSFTIIRRLLSDLNLSSDQLSDAQLEAIFWALKIARH